MIQKKLDNRIKRLVGQLQKVQEDISSDKDCLHVITQFMAIKGAANAAFQEYVKQSIDTCSHHDEQKMKQLVAVLIKS